MLDGSLSAWSTSSPAYRHRRETSTRVCGEVLPPGGSSPTDPGRETFCQRPFKSNYHPFPLVHRRTGRMTGAYHSADRCRASPRVHPLDCDREQSATRAPATSSSCSGAGYDRARPGTKSQRGNGSSKVHPRVMAVRSRGSFDREKTRERGSSDEL